MVRAKMNVIKFGGVTFIISGILFFAQYLFMRPLPNPPLPDAELLSWLQEWKFNLSMADEVLVFAALLLIPATIALYRILGETKPILTLLGCGLLAASVPVYLFLVIILGRLVYPVYGIELSPDINRLMISMYYGGIHLAGLLVGCATILLSLVLRTSRLGKLTAYLGIAAGVFDIIGSYPWLLGPAVILISQLLFAGWFVVLGIKVLSGSDEPAR